jgi:hypothetical protein
MLCPVFSKSRSGTNTSICLPRLNDGSHHIRTPSDLENELGARSRFEVFRAYQYESRSFRSQPMMLTDALRRSDSGLLAPLDVHFPLGVPPWRGDFNV